MNDDSLAARTQRFQLSLSEIIPPLAVPADTRWIKRIRLKSELLSRFWGRYEFYKSWSDDDFPQAIAVSFQHPTPFADMSGFVNSVNNGP